jgi:hypothetical protein
MIIVKRDNWDSYGGKATTPEAERTVLHMSDSWVPLPDGGMMLDYGDGDRELNIEISPTGRIRTASLLIED